MRVSRRSSCWGSRLPGARTSAAWRCFARVSTPRRRQRFVPRSRPRGRAPNGRTTWRSRCGRRADEAETAAEQAATLSDGEFNPLRDGLLGNVRYAAARKVEAEDLRAALGLAEQARAHYLRGAVALDGRPELARNLERALRLIEELKKKIEEQEEQQDEDEEGDQEQNEDQQDGEDGKSDEKQEQDQKGDGEQPSEPQQSDEPQPEDQQDQKSEGEQEEQPPAPGEQLEGRQLTPEEKKRLLDKLDELEEMRIELRKLQKAARPKVKRDW